MKTAIPTSTDILIWRILDTARNYIGPLDAEYRARLEAVLRKPSQATWDNAHSIIVATRGGKTLWQSVIAVARAFPQSKPDEQWSIVPTQELLLTALRTAVLGETVMPTTLRGWPTTPIGGDYGLRWYLPSDYFIDREPTYMRRAYSGKYTVYRSGASPSGGALGLGATNKLADALTLARTHLELMMEGQVPSYEL